MGKWKPAENTNTDNQLKKGIMHNFWVKFVFYIKTNKQMHNICLYCNPFFRPIHEISRQKTDKRSTEVMQI